MLHESRLQELILTEYIIAAREISGLRIQEVKFLSPNKHTGAEISVTHRLYKKTTVISSGYISMIRV